MLGSSTVAAGGSTTLIITYTPAGSGSFSFDLDIPSDDADENPYDIAISGGAVNAGIAVFDAFGREVPNDGKLKFTGLPHPRRTNFEFVTIKNTGTASLALEPVIASNLKRVLVESLTLSEFTVSAGSSATLRIAYRPTSIAPPIFDLTIVSNASDASPYTFTVMRDGRFGREAAARIQAAGSQSISSTFAKSIASNVQNRFSQARGGRGRVFANNLSQFSNTATTPGALPLLSSGASSSTGDLGEALGQIGEHLGFYDGNGWTSFTTDDLLIAANSFSAFQSQVQVEQLEADHRAGLSPVDQGTPFTSLLPDDGLDFYGSYSGGHYYRKGVDAYKGFSSELAVGLDGFVTEDLFAGIALASEASRIEFSGTTQGSMMKEGVRTDIYAAWEAFDAISIEGLASYGRFANKVTTLGETGKPNSERWIISGRANLDYNWDRFLITPNASISYTSETYDAYLTDFGTAVDALRVERGSWSAGLRVQGFKPIIYGLNGYAAANAEGTWDTSSATTNSTANTVTAAWEIGLNGSLAGFADGTWLGDVLSTADTDIRYSQSGLFGQDRSSNWSVALRWNF